MELFETDRNRVSHLLDHESESETGEIILFTEQYGGDDDDDEQNMMKLLEQARKYQQTLHQTTNGGNWNHPKAPSDKHMGGSFFNIEFHLDDPDDEITATEAENMVFGGAESDTKMKRGASPAFMQFIKIVSVMKKSGKYGKFKHKQLGSICKFIVKDAKEMTKSSDPSVYGPKAEQLATTNSEKYIKMFESDKS